MTHAEVLVIGAGPAGIAAATAAAEYGRHVIVLDDNPKPGGQIWREATVVRPANAKPDTAKGRALQRLHRSGAKLLQSRRVFSASAKGHISALHETGCSAELEEFSFDRLVLATGARERFLPFPGWTLPGVFGAGGLQALVRGGYSVAGKRVVVAGTGPLLMAVAAHLAHDGARLVSVLEQSSAAHLASFTASLWKHPGKLWQGARYRTALWHTPYRTGCWVEEALPSEAGNGLQAVRVANGSRHWDEECDLLAIGYHLVPNTELASLLGCALHNGFVQVNENQQTSQSNIFSVGEPTVIAGLDAALAQGELAGLVCAGQDSTQARKHVAAEKHFGERLATTFALRDELRLLPQENTLVCRCEDVAMSALRKQRGWTDSKLQTRCGMGPCQGRICGPAVEFLLGWQPASVREPLFPVPMHALSSWSTSGASSPSGKLLEATEETV